MSSADKASWTRLPAPALPEVTPGAERCVTQPGHPAVSERGQQPAGWAGHLLQDETGQSHTVFQLAKEKQQRTATVMKQTVRKL